MRGGSKTLVVALAALLIAVGLVACGGDDSSSSTSTEASPEQTESTSTQEASKQSGDKGEGKSGSDDKGQPHYSGPSASDFTSKPHSDSGGGSASYKTKGGDNSVQEFGAEADTSEFDAAATALHNFLDARAEGNWAATCEYISKTITESLEKLAAQAKQLEDKSCPTLLSALINPAAAAAMKAEAEQANVRSLRIEGERGFVLYTGPHGTILSMPMANEDGVWKVSSLSGYPLN